MTFNHNSIQDFSTQISGKLIQPSDAAYDEARQLYNGMIDKKPALIVKASNVHDVVAAVNFARENAVTLAVRGGGHNGAGLGSVDDGLVLDLGDINHVEVQANGRFVKVGGGATFGEVDATTVPQGLVIPGGVISSTGVGGLTLGGGMGYFSRKYGLTVDHLRRATVVLADGSVVTASADEHPNLFWGLRGGGGNFGIVVEFVFEAQPTDTVLAGPVFWDISEAEAVMQWYRKFIVDAPEDLYGFFAFLTVPPGPPFPEHLHGKVVAGIVWSYSGPKDKADEVLAPIRNFGSPIMDGIQEMPVTVLNGMFDALYPPGLQWYWRGDFFDELNDEAIALHLEHGTKLPTGFSTMHLYPINGAAGRVGQQETAFSYRDAVWSAVYAGVDPDPANAELIRDWTVNYYEALHPHSMGGAYVNFMMEEGPSRVKATYRDNYERLAAVKAQYDPTNFFSVNQNVRPVKEFA